MSSFRVVLSLTPYQLNRIDKIRDLAENNDRLYLGLNRYDRKRPSRQDVILYFLFK